MLILAVREIVSIASSRMTKTKKLYCRWKFQKPWWRKHQWLWQYLMKFHGKIPGMQLAIDSLEINWTPPYAHRYQFEFHVRCLLHHSNRPLHTQHSTCTASCCICLASDSIARTWKVYNRMTRIMFMFFFGGFRMWQGTFSTSRFPFFHSTWPHQ